MLTSRSLLLVSMIVALSAPTTEVFSQPNAAPQLATYDALSDSTLGTPFGLRIGMSREELARLGKLEVLPNGLYQLAPVPRPHEAFEGYAVVVSETHGLCKIIAASKSVRTKSDGTELRAAFTSILVALSERYGKHLTVNSTFKDAKLTKPGDFMEALSKKQRTLWAVWDAEEKSSLPPHIVGIELETIAESKHEGYFKLRYEFSNFGACKAELDKAQSGGFQN
jgi:hypothetical protein